MAHAQGSTDSTALAPGDSRGSGVLADDRPYGVHVRLGRGRAILVILAVPASLFILQLLFFPIVTAVEGPPDPQAPRLTPLTILISGVSTAVMAVVTTALFARLAGVPWKTVFRHGRPFDWRSVGLYLGVAAVLVGASTLATGLIVPESTGWGSVDVGAVTIAIIVATLVATPLQAAGEEVGFRGVVGSAAGSLFRSVRPAAICAIVISGIAFTAVHVPREPWLVGYLMVFSACTVVMGLLSGGLEAAMAFHVSNNVLVGIVNAVFAGNDASVVDRGAAAGPGPAFIILMVMDVTMVGAVWLIERRRRRGSSVMERGRR